MGADENLVYHRLLRIRGQVLVQNVQFLSACQLDLVCAPVRRRVLDTLAAHARDFALCESP